MTAINSEQVPQVRKTIEAAVQEIADHLGNPSLVMYYPNEAEIAIEDVRTLYRLFRQAGITSQDPLPALSVILHTLGGNPDASYRLAQLVRDFANHVTFVVPEYAYSGGTAITLAGDRIVLGGYAVLSPIDVGLVPLHDSSDEDMGERLEFVAIDHYIKMAADARIQVELSLQEANIPDATSAVDEALMTSMVNNPTNAMLIGKYYRQRAIAETYARQLLKDYMLKDASPERVKNVIDGLIVNAPDHDFDLDFHMCSDIGLVIHEADLTLSDSSKRLLRTLENATRANIICRRKSNNSPYRAPFFYYTTSSEASIPSCKEVPDDGIQAA